MATLDGARGLSEGRDSLAEILRNIGEQAAREARRDQAEIERLRLQLAEFDHIKQENGRLRKELEIPASDIDSSEELSPELKRNESQSQSPPENHVAERKARRSLNDIFEENGVQGEKALHDELPDTAAPAWTDERLALKYNDLMVKYQQSQDECERLAFERNELMGKCEQSRDEYDVLRASSKNLQKNHRSVLEARHVLERKVREMRDRNNEWQLYAGKLNERNNQLKAEMAACPHGHRDVLNSRSPEYKIPRRSLNLTSTGHPESGGTTPRPPFGHDRSATPTGLSRIITPVSASFDDRLENLRSSPPISVNASTKLSNGSRSSPNRRKDDARKESRTFSSSPQLPAAQVSALVVTPQEIEPRSSRHDEVSSNQEMLPFDELVQELPRLADRDGNSKSQESNHPSSTQGVPYPTQYPEPKSDTPVIKSEGESPILILSRKIQKPKSRGTNTGNGAFKAEETSSSPAAPAAMDFGESMDLDDHPYMPTPRKRRAPMSSSRVNPSELDDSVDQDAGVSVGVPASTAILVERSPERPSRSSNTLQPLTSNKLLLQRTGDGQPPQKRRLRDGPAGLKTSLLEKDEESTRQIRGLKNKKPRGLFSDVFEATETRSRSDVAKLGSTPNSGEVGQQHNLTPGTSPRLPRPLAKQGSLAASRLSRLQGEPKIASSGDIFDPPSSSPKEAERSAPSSRATGSSRKKSPELRMNAPADDHPDNEPLRARPLERLKLDDFKVNPKYNQGYSHAFSDVVRNKEERRCLPGCEQECCGPQFRKLAEMTIASRMQPISEASREKDKKLISDFLGDEFPKFSKFSQEKKTDTLIRAMARQLANDHGKHRHAYARAGSPPGYWNTDFPATQEMQEIRKAAAKAERQKVEERYREAMRPVGAYVFRDE